MPKSRAEAFLPVQKLAHFEGGQYGYLFYRIGTNCALDIVSAEENHKPDSGRNDPAGGDCS